MVKSSTKVPFGRDGVVAINRLSDKTGIHNDNNEEPAMWTKPAFNDLRLGFEVTLYINNR